MKFSIKVPLPFSNSFIIFFIEHLLYVRHHSRIYAQEGKKANKKFCFHSIYIWKQVWEWQYKSLSQMLIDSQLRSGRPWYSGHTVTEARKTPQYGISGSHFHWITASDQDGMYLPRYHVSTKKKKNWHIGPAYSKLPIYLKRRVFYKK